MFDLISCLHCLFAHIVALVVVVAFVVEFVIVDLEYCWIVEIHHFVFLLLNRE